jgi:hypothetical protein
MDLNSALQQFDAVEANLAKLDSVWQSLTKLVPEGIAFLGSSPEGREYRQLARDFQHLLKGLPSIDGFSIAKQPLDLDEIAQGRLDAREVGEIEAQVAIERAIEEPGLEIDEYRSRLARKRNQLARIRLEEIIAEVDRLLVPLAEAIVHRDDPASVRCAEWEQIEVYVAEIDRLFGSAPRSPAWRNLRRHLGFAMGVDLMDIVENDWPAVKSEIARLEYDRAEPLTVAVADLGELVAAKPTGRVSTALNWSALDDAGFERLIFSILGDASGYQNPEWLMHTNAPDRGRDLSVTRVRDDSLSGVARDRMIIQCRHWLSRSVTDVDISNALVRISHWEPPAVDVVVMATSGRFTADAVKWAERHNHEGKRPRVELWPESHLERLLAQRPQIAASFGLR